MPNTEKLTLITLANFRSGGKSSLARLIAEKSKSSILNFDTERNAEHYNAINTINIQKNKKITRQSNSLILSDDLTEQEIKSKSGIIVCDLGGYFDSRVIDLKSDVYVIPSFDDYESIRETMRTAHYILKQIPNAKIIFVLNGVMINNSTLRKEKKKEFLEHIEVNGFLRFSYVYLPYTSLMRKLVDQGSKKSEIKGKYDQDIRYSKIDKFIENLFEYIN